MAHWEPWQADDLLSNSSVLTLVSSVLCQIVPTASVTFGSTLRPHSHLFLLHQITTLQSEIAGGFFIMFSLLWNDSVVVSKDKTMLNIPGLTALYFSNVQGKEKRKGKKTPLGSTVGVMGASLTHKQAKPKFVFYWLRKCTIKRKIILGKWFLKKKKLSFLYVWGRMHAHWLELCCTCVHSLGERELNILYYCLMNVTANTVSFWCLWITCSLSSSSLAKTQLKTPNLATAVRSSLEGRTAATCSSRQNSIRKAASYDHLIVFLVRSMRMEKYLISLHTLTTDIRKENLHFIHIHGKSETAHWTESPG